MDLGYCKILKRKNNMDNKDYTRRNRFNGETIELTKEEAKRHDEIFYYEALATAEDEKAGVDGTSKLWDKVRSNLDWFRQHNAKAYMVLLD
tara:strand:+ start:296 stop:568 length:273 start_codon:yes stop_codon:yes gene_type:complete